VSMGGSEVSIGVVKFSWVKCSEVLQCSDVVLVLFYDCVYGCMFCILLLYFCLIL